MYKSSYFKADNQADVLEFMRQNSFVTLVGFDGIFPVATQVPVKVVVTDESIKLVGHIMTKTDHCKAFKLHPNVMAIFTGAHAYISASVYEKPESASTWNYKTVQAKGVIRLLGADETYSIIRDITNHYEKTESPAAFHKMDDAYIQKHLSAIMGFEITVGHLDHVFKLSQNHSDHNQDSIIQNLQKSNDPLAHEVARDMIKSKKTKA